MPAMIDVMISIASLFFFQTSGIYSTRFFVSYIPLVFFPNEWNIFHSFFFSKRVEYIPLVFLADDDDDDNNNNDDNDVEDER